MGVDWHLTACQRAPATSSNKRYSRTVSGICQQPVVMSSGIHTLHDLSLVAIMYITFGALIEHGIPHTEQ